MLMGEPFFQARATEGVQAVDQGERLIEDFGADETDQFLLQVQQACRRRGVRSGHVCRRSRWLMAHSWRGNVGRAPDDAAMV